MPWEKEEWENTSDGSKAVVIVLAKFKIEEEGKTYFAVFFWEEKKTEYFTIGGQEELVPIKDEKEWTEVEDYWRNKCGIICLYDDEKKEGLTVCRIYQQLTLDDNEYTIFQELDEDFASKGLIFYRNSTSQSENVAVFDDIIDKKELERVKAELQKITDQDTIE